MTDYQLLVVAHPDDEAIFFSSLLLKRRDLPWKVICVTDGNADGQGLERRQQWLESMQAFKITDHEHWDFPDIFAERLDISALKSRLMTLNPPTIAYTHGILGEYGHPHHQDVSYAVHSVFGEIIPVYSCAYNCHSDFAYCLSKEEFSLKLSTLWQIYGSQFSRFAHKLPATEYEGFHRVSSEETDCLYQYLAYKKKFSRTMLVKMVHLYDHILTTLGEPIQRSF